MLLVISAVFLVMGLGIIALSQMAWAASRLASVHRSMPSLGVVFIMGWLPYSLMMLGEPRARWRRIYAASGRIDVVTFRGVRGYSKDRYDLTPDPKPFARFPGNRARLTLIDRETGATRALGVFNHHHAAVVELWNLDAIAPRFGA